MQKHNNKLNQNLIERITMGDVLRNRARDSGNHEVIVELIEGQRVATTYQELNQTANQLVRGLRSQGLKQGDRLALLCSNRKEFLVVSFACYKAGIVLVPINFLQGEEDIRYNFDHAEVKAIIYESSLENVSIAAAKGLNNIIKRVIIGEKTQQTQLSLTELITGQDSAEIEDIVILDQDIATLLYTSGTTSRPKGVETSHKALYLTSMSTPLSLGYQRYHRQYNLLPMFHCAAWAFSISTIQMGGCIISQAQFNPQEVVSLLQSEKVNSTLLLPVMWKALLQVPDVEKGDYSAFKQAVYGIASMDKKSLKTLKDTFCCDFHLGSGQTEFTPVTNIFYDSTETENIEGNYWGLPTLSTEHAILDDHGNELPTGVVGEICWRGPQVMTGYLKNQEASEEASLFGWHHSGDLGLIDNKGQLMFVDRKKDMIKTGGENVASNRIEATLMNIDGIVQSAVFGVYHPRWSEAVCACVVLAKGCTLNEAAIINTCKKELGGFQVPKRVMIVSTLPATSTGKVQKQYLRAEYKDLFAETS